MSFITEGTGSFFTGAAKVDANPSALPAENKLVAAEANEIHDALLNIRSQFVNGTEEQFRVWGTSGPQLHIEPVGGLGIQQVDEIIGMDIHVSNDTGMPILTPAIVGVNLDNSWGFMRIFDSAGSFQNSKVHVDLTGTLGVGGNIGFTDFPTEGRPTTVHMGSLNLEVVAGTDDLDITTQPVFIIKKQGNENQTSCGVIPYDVAGYFGGNPALSGTIMAYLSAREFAFHDSWNHSRAQSEVTASSGQDFSIKVAGLEVGKITFGAGDNIGAFSGSGEVFVVAGDLIKIEASGSQDTTLADIAVTLAGYYIGKVL